MPSLEVKTVADLKERRHIVFVGGLVLLCEIFAAELIDHGVELGCAVLVQRRKDLDGRLGVGEVLALFQLGAHHLGGKRCPTAVLNQSHGAVAEIALNQMIDKIAHKGEDIGIVGGGCQHDLAVTEGIAHGLGEIAAGKVMNNDLGATVRLQLFRQLLDSLLGIAVDGGVGNHNTLFLGLIARPSVIEIEVVAEILGQNGTVQRADDGDIQSCGLLEQCLHLCAVLADNADIVAASLVRPRLLDIQRTEFAEAVGREKHLIGAVIGHDDLRPMHHGSGHKGQRVLAEREGVALADNDAVVREIGTEEVLHHGKRLGRGHQLRVGVSLDEVDDIGRVVGLHVLNDEIIGGSVAQRVLNIIKPLVGEVGIHGVHDRDRLVDDGIGVVSHAIGNLVLTLKEVHAVVVYADIANVLCDRHCLRSSVYDNCPTFLLFVRTFLIF